MKRERALTINTMSLYLDTSDIYAYFNAKGANTKSTISPRTIPEINTNRSLKLIFKTILSLVLVTFFLLGIIAIALDQHYTSVAPKCATCQLKISIIGLENLFTLNVFTVSEYLCTSEDKIRHTFGFIRPSRVRAPPLSIFS
jgi:hypothetical protein